MKKHRKTLLDSRLDAQRDTLNAVVQAAGGAQIDLARVLGVTQAAVSKWVTRGWVPLARAREIEALYGVPRTKVANPTMVDALTDASLV